jgi:hypothetical protein
MSLDKMHDEKLEKRNGGVTLEAGFASEDGKMAKRVLFKMDFRYVPLFPPSLFSFLCLLVVRVCV